jgi:ABC-2 type transport system permease protein
MRDLLAAYRGMLGASVARAVAYRAQLSIWILTSLFPLVLLAVWLSLVDEVGPADGWTRSDFIAYYVAAAVLFHITSSFVTWQWDDDIRSGDLSFRLLKPVSPIHHFVAMDLGFKLVTAAVLVPLVVVVAFVVDGVRYSSDIGHIVLFPVAVVIGYAVSTAMALAFSMGTFWTTQVGNLYSLWWGGGAFLSGWIAPVSVLPGWLQDAALVLPFYPTIGFPLELLLGRLDSTQITQGFASGLIWLGVFAAAQQLLWRRGVVRYQAVGG